MPVGNKPLHLALALKQYYYYARELIQLFQCLLRVSNSYIAFNETQEVLLDHQASHITLQVLNFSSLPHRSCVSIGSAPSWPGWPFLANTRWRIALQTVQCSSSTGETHTSSGTQVAHPSSSNPKYPFPDLSSVTTLTILHRALWFLLAKQSMTHTSSLYKTSPKDNIYAAQQKSCWNTDTEK